MTAITELGASPNILNSARFPNFSGIAGSAASHMFVMHKDLRLITQGNVSGSPVDFAGRPYEVANGSVTETAGGISSIVRIKVPTEYHSIQVFQVISDANEDTKQFNTSPVISIFGRHDVGNSIALQPNALGLTDAEAFDHYWLPLRFPVPSSKGSANAQTATGTLSGSGSFEMYAHEFVASGEQGWSPAMLDRTTDANDSAFNRVEQRGTTNKFIFYQPFTLLLDGCSEIITTVKTSGSSMHGNAVSSHFLMGRLLG